VRSARDRSGGNIRWIGSQVDCDMAKVRRYLDSGHRLIYKDI
jgi:hypothetical protein